MLGVILEAGGVQLSEGQQIYHRLSGMSSALKPGDKISCEDTKVTLHNIEFSGRMDCLIPAIESSPESDVLR